MQNVSARSDITAEQALQVREQYPELFEYLTRREETLLGALRRAPSPADIELSATYNRANHLAKAIDRAGPGLAELCRDCATTSTRTGW